MAVTGTQMDFAAGSRMGGFGAGVAGRLRLRTSPDHGAVSLSPSRATRGASHESDAAVLSLATAIPIKAGRIFGAHSYNGNSGGRNQRRRQGICADAQADFQRGG